MTPVPASPKRTGQGEGWWLWWVSWGQPPPHTHLLHCKPGRGGQGVPLPGPPLSASSPAPPQIKAACLPLHPITSPGEDPQFPHAHALPSFQYRPHRIPKPLWGAADRVARARASSGRRRAAQNMEILLALRSSHHLDASLGSGDSTDLTLQ